MHENVAQDDASGPALPATSAEQKTKWGRRMLWSALALVILLTAVTGAVCWIATNSLLYPDSDPLPSASALSPLAVEDVSFVSADGIVLSGWYLPPPSCGDVAAPCAPARAVVLSHGRGENRGAFINEIPMYHRAGYSVLAFDYRGSGSSEKAPVTIGAKEQDDLIAAVAFVRKQRGTVDAPVVVVGRSMGASVAVLAAARDQGIGAVVDNAGFARLTDVIAYNFSSEAHLPSFPFAPLTVELAEQRAHIDVGAVAPVDVVAKIEPRPVLIIHGTADTKVRFDQSEQIFAAAGAHKTLWRLEGVQHVKAYDSDPAEYERRVIGFINGAFAA